jgi:SAM-dependent methyltransferase
MGAIDPKDAAIRKFASAGGLEASLDVIMRCATDPPMAISTLLDALRPAAAAGARICELGFGSGWLLEEMLAAFRQTRIYGLDMSAAYAARARDLLDREVPIMLGDMERLPVCDGAFDAIVTCWTLYFMRDIDATLEEIRRCLRPGGTFVTATVAPDHMREFDELVGAAVRSALGRDADLDIGTRFDTETGASYVRRAFPDAELREWRGELVVQSVEPLLVLWPVYGPQIADPGDDGAARAEFERLAQRRINRDGLLRITRHDGAFVGIK